jgi:hypothetical protein
MNVIIPTSRIPSCFVRSLLGLSLLGLLGSCRPTAAQEAAAPPMELAQKASAPLAEAPAILDLAPSASEAVLWTANLMQGVNEARAFLDGVLLAAGLPLPTRTWGLQQGAAPGASADMFFEIFAPEMADRVGLDFERGMLLFLGGQQTSVGVLGVTHPEALNRFLVEMVAPQFGAAPQPTRQAHGDHTLFELALPQASTTLWWSFVQRADAQYVMASLEPLPKGLVGALDALDDAGSTAAPLLREQAAFIGAQQQLGTQLAAGSGSWNLFVPPTADAGGVLARLHLDHQGTELTAFIPGRVPSSSLGRLADRQSTLASSLRLAQHEPADAALLSLSHAELWTALDVLRQQSAEIEKLLPPVYVAQFQPLLAAISTLKPVGRLHASMRRGEQDDWVSELTAEANRPDSSRASIEERFAQLTWHRSQLEDVSVPTRLSEAHAGPMSLGAASQPGKFVFAAPATAIWDRLSRPARAEDNSLTRHSYSLGRLLEGEDLANVAEVLVLRLDRLLPEADRFDRSTGMCLTPGQILQAALPHLGDVVLVLRLQPSGLHLHLANLH